MNLLIQRTAFDRDLSGKEVMVLTLKNGQITDGYKGIINQIFESGSMCMVKNIIGDKSEIYNIDDINDTFIILKYDYILYHRIKSSIPCQLGDIESPAKDRISTVAHKECFLNPDIIFEKIKTFTAIDNYCCEDKSFYFTVDNLYHANTIGNIKEITIRGIEKLPNSKPRLLPRNDIRLNADSINDRIKNNDRLRSHKIELSDLAFYKDGFLYINNILICKDAEIDEYIDIYIIIIG